MDKVKHKVCQGHIGVGRRQNEKCHHLTFNVVGTVAELQAEDVINGSAGVQRVGFPVVADEAVLPPQDQHGPVDEFQSEPFVLAWWVEEDGSRDEEASSGAASEGETSNMT